MIKRALLIGTILAGLTGAAVYYGLGDKLGENLGGNPAKTVDTKVVEAEVETKSNKAVFQSPITQAPIGGTSEHDAVEQASQSEKTVTKLDDGHGSGNDGGLSHEVEVAPEDASVRTVVPTTAFNKVKGLLKPKSTGSVVVSEAPLDETTDKTNRAAAPTIMSEDLVSSPVVVYSVPQAAPIDAGQAEVPHVDMTDQEIDALNMSLKEARRITDKTARDKIYLEIFDNAIDSGNMDMARRVGDKLSSPELRRLATEIIANSVK